MGIFDFFLAFAGQNRLYDELMKAKKERNRLSGELSRSKRGYSSLEGKLRSSVAEAADLSDRLARMTSSYHSIANELQSYFSQYREMRAEYEAMEKKVAELESLADVKNSREMVQKAEEAMLGMQKNIGNLQLDLAEIIYPFVSQYDGKKIALVNVTEDPFVQDTLRVVIGKNVDFLEHLNGVPYDILIVADSRKYDAYSGTIIQCGKHAGVAEIIRSLAQI